jgi:glutamate racemase
VIACNTVSTTIIDDLKRIIPAPLISTEPMVNEAAQLTKTGVIAICATRATLASERYAELKRMYADGLNVLEPDCNDWVLMIENDSVDHQKIKSTIDVVCQGGADVIVFGCTHYHWIEALVTAIANDRAIVLQPEQIIIKQVRRALKQLA